MTASHRFVYMSAAHARLVTCAVLVSLLVLPLHAIERRPLPDFAISALDGTAVTSAALVTPGQWLLVYVQLGCSSCDTLIQAVADEQGDLARHMVVVIGGVDAAAAAKLAGAFPTLSAARWYADPARSLADVLSASGAPVVYGLRENMLEWSLIGVVPDEAAYKTALVSWVSPR